MLSVVGISTYKLLLNSAMNFILNIVFCLVVVEIVSVVKAIQDNPSNSELAKKQFCGFQRYDDFPHKPNESIDLFPWLAALIYKFNTEDAKALLCSGALINTRFVITAAQCLTQARNTTLVAVRLGEHNVKTVKDCVSIDLNLANNDNTQECNSPVNYGIERKIPHPQYNGETGANDIALLKLDKNVEYTDFIRPICVLKSQDSKPGDLMHISGWGRKTYKGTPAETKKTILATLITNEQCAKEFSERMLNDNYMCTRDLANNTEFTCEGDSGAPVMFQFNNQWHLKGVSSWGGRCGAGQVGVHTNVLKYITWIENMIQ